MFCGNCGKEIPNGVAFCPECGEKTVLDNVNSVSEVEYSPKRKMSKKTKIAILMGALLLAFVFGGIKTAKYISEIPSTKEIQQVSNNLENNSFVTSDGKWILYFENNNLCKEKLSDGKSKQTVINDRTLGEMFCLGNKLYIESLSAYSITDLKGKNIAEIPNTTFCENKFKTDGKVCYFGSFRSELGNVCSQKLNGKKVKSISDIIVSSISFDGKYLYLFSPYDSVSEQNNSDKGVTRINTDGSKPLHILDFCPRYFIFYEDRIYYTEGDSLFSMKSDGSDKRQFKDIEVGNGLNVYDGYIYYVDSSTRNICKMGIDDDSYTKVLTNCSADGISIFNDWIVYRNSDETSDLYKMKLDGSNNQLVNA